MFLLSCWLVCFFSHFFFFLFRPAINYLDMKMFSAASQSAFYLSGCHQLPIHGTVILWLHPLAPTQVAKWNLEARTGEYMEVGVKKQWPVL